MRADLPTGTVTFLFTDIEGSALLIGTSAAGVSLGTSAKLGAAVVLLWMLYVAALAIPWNT